MGHFSKKDVIPALQVLNGISIGFASLVVLLLAIIAYFYYGLTKRVTFRIQGLIALLDITRHISIFMKQDPKSSLCMFFGFYMLFADNLYIFLNIVIAMNIHLIGIRNVAPSSKLCFKLLSSAILISFVLNLGAYVFGVIGEKPGGQCFIKKDLEYRWLAKLILVYLPYLPGMIYCTYVSCSTIYKSRIKKEYKDVVKHSEIETPQMPYIKTIQFIKKLHLRIALLPLFCVISIFWFVTSSIVYDIAKYKSDIISSLSMLGMRSAGTLNFVAFVLDPYFQIAFKRIVFHSTKDDVFSYDVEDGGSPRFHVDGTGKSEDLEFEKIAAMRFDSEDLKILGQRKYVKLL